MQNNTPEPSPQSFFESLKTPAAADALLERYRREREIMRAFHKEALEFMARRAFGVCARRIGIPVRKKDGEPLIIFDSELDISLLDIFCLMLDDKCGTTPRKKFVRAHAGETGTDAAIAAIQFDGYRYSWFLVTDTIPGTALLCHDLLAHRDIVVADVGLSKSTPPGGALAGGLLPLSTADGPCYMTDGACLPLPRLPREDLEQLLRTFFSDLHIHKTPPCDLKDSETASLAAAWIRTSRELGYADHVVFADENGDPDFNSPFP